MRANTWAGRNKVEVRDVPDPRILNQRDAIVRIRSRGLVHRRMVPWQALTAPAGHQAGRVRLVLNQADLVLQRGVPVLDSREQPTLSAGRAAPVLTEAIAWYLAHPDERAGIGTVAGFDRLHEHLRSAAPAPAPPATAAPARPGRVGAIVRLVHAAAAVAVVTAAADLSIAVVFRDRLLAAEHALAAADPMPPEGELLFSNETVGFATGSATVALIVTLALATVGVALVHKVRAGSGPARTALTILSGVVAVMAVCSGAASVMPLATEPAAGTGLNVWAVFRMIEIMTLTGSALLVLALLVIARAGAPGMTALLVPHGSAGTGGRYPIG